MEFLDFIYICKKHRKPQLRRHYWGCDDCDFQPLRVMLPVVAVIGTLIGVFGGVWFSS